MDRIAIISDIHGNIPALEAVLKDIGRIGIDKIYCLGDLVGKGPSSDRAVDICKEVCECIVMGNWDANIAINPNTEMKKWHHNMLGNIRVEYLKNLKSCIDISLGGNRIRLFHASHSGIYNRVHEHDPVEIHESMFSNTEFTGYASTPDIVAYGDIHHSFKKDINGKILLNPGSVGNPLDIPRASFAVIEGNGGKDLRTEIRIEIHKIEYDIEKAIFEAEKSGMPGLEPYKNELRTAEYRGLQKK